jgi:hypothetical protein
LNIIFKFFDLKNHFYTYNLSEYDEICNDILKSEIIADHIQLYPISDYKNIDFLVGNNLGASRLTEKITRLQLTERVSRKGLDPVHLNLKYHKSVLSPKSVRPNSRGDSICQGCSFVFDSGKETPNLISDCIYFTTSAIFCRNCYERFLPTQQAISFLQRNYLDFHKNISPIDYELEQFL